MMVPAADLDEAEERFHSYYEAELGRNVQLVEGIAEVIDHARSLGWRVGVFTGRGGGLLDSRWWGWGSGIGSSTWSPVMT